MPIFETPAADAVRQLEAGGQKQHLPSLRNPRGDLTGVVEVDFKPSFEIAPGDRIFTAGSCFARNIERRLREVGLDTVMRSTEISEQLEALGESTSFLNKYNISSIRTEMEWALGASRPPEEMLLIPSPKTGAMLDVLSNPRRLMRQPPERARALRALSDGLMAHLAQCRIVIVTLGLVEVWRDNQSGLLLNVVPLNAIREQPGRFVFEVLSYDDVLQDLEAIHRLLSAHGHPDVQMVVTVSPVPLNATFRDMDLLSANTYSKAVQRAAVDAFTLRHGNVDYYPSYEMVTLTDRRLAFETDDRHVQRAVVDRVVDRFIRAYAPSVALEETSRPLAASPAMSDTAVGLLGAAKAHAAALNFKKAADAYERLITTLGDRHPEIATAALYERYGSLLLKTGRSEEGLAAFERAAQASDLDPGVAVALAERLVSLGNVAAAQQAIDRAAGLGADPARVANLRATLQSEAALTR